MESQIEFVCLSDIYNRNCPEIRKYTSSRACFLWKWNVTKLLLTLYYFVLTRNRRSRDYTSWQSGTAVTLAQRCLSCLEALLNRYLHPESRVRISPVFNSLITKFWSVVIEFVSFCHHYLILYFQTQILYFRSCCVQESEECQSFLTHGITALPIASGSTMKPLSFWFQRLGNLPISSRLYLGLLLRGL